MQPTKLIVLLQTFDKEEMKRFGDYIQSPYFNKREAPINLYKALMPLHPTFEPLKWEKVFKKAFSDKTAYNETYLRNVLSDLFGLAEGFWGQEHVKNQPFLLGYLVDNLIAKRQYKYAEDNLKEMQVSLLTKNMFYPTLYTTTCFYNLLKMRLHDRQEQRQAYSETQQQLANAVKAQCINDVLERYYEMSNDAEVYYKYPYQFDFFERFIAIIQPADIENDTSLATTYYLLQLQLQKSWQAWHNLYHYLQQNKVAIQPYSVFMCNQALTNFLAHQKRKEPYLSEEIQKKEFELYEENIELRRKNGQPLTGSLFENIVVSGMTVKGSDWAKQYIETNNPHLPANIREGLTAYCLARLHFYTGDYIETIAILANIEPYYHHYYFDVKSLMLLAYYELDNYDAFMATLDAFKHTLANHPELADKHRTAHANMNTILLKLYRLRLKYSYKAAQELQQLLDNPDLSTFSKQWAIHQLNALTHQDVATV